MSQLRLDKIEFKVFVLCFDESLKCPGQCGLHPTASLDPECDFEG